MPNSCPLCGSEVRVEPSLPFGDAPCPSCGTLLFFLSQGSETRFFDYAAVVAHLLGIPKDEVTAKDVEAFKKRFEEDSLDLQELLIEFEESWDEA